MQNTKNFLFEAQELSDVGMVRKVNEDSVLISETCSAWIVADGMGGHAGGDFASQTIVQQMQTLGIPASAEDLIQRFKDRLTTANNLITQRSDELARGSIGSTLAALLAFDGRFICFWSGDSRVYRLRNRQLRRVSKDHTEVQALLDAGAISPQEAETWPRKNVITHAIGVTREPIFDVIEGGIEDGDMFLICSDGMTEYFMDSEVEDALNTQDVTLADLCAFFVQTSLERGGKDNVSVIIVKATEQDFSESSVSGQYPEYGGLI
jgi:serine/threonine protein phosphatase PrpC